MATSKKKVKKTAAKKKIAAKKSVVKMVAPNKASAKKAPAKTTMIVNIPADFLTPLEDRLLVAMEAASDTSPGGLYIPESASDRPHRGRVLAAGRGRRNKKGQLRPLDVSAGDTVLFDEHAGTKITVEGNEFLILREEDVLGIVT